MAAAHIGIFGSCVSRDLFEEPALRPTLAHYASRSSVISVVADPVALDPALVKLDSPFQRRCVLEDFDKTFFEQLRDSSAEWLVVDLIDERFEVLLTAESCVTRSSAFVGAGLDDALGHGLEPVRRLTDEADELLERAVAAFASRLRDIIAPERVIVHRALWLTRYRDGAEVRPFEADRVVFADRHNAALDRAYDHLEARLGVAQSIAPQRDRYLCDANHRWALEPYHYEADYNAAATERLRDIVGI